ncbi:alpha/beta hydrolase [Microbacterium terrisoli]|uniref:alpha/beta hydrolase n=1 Tax=Microbacterium terrisoli TaxID=3242192 RepID=UPI00280516DD|nr:alpha/beta hydrolase [Microbacterium protaetiae]
MSETTPAKRLPVMFIHGLWIHASAWRAWQDLFEASGHATSAPGWPGDGETVQATRDHPESLDDVGIAAICRHYADLIDDMPVKPIVIGHSFGGLIAQELLANGYATAAVAIDPAPVKGVKILPFSQLRSAFPVLGNPANRKRTVALTAEQFKYSFGNTLSDEESNALHEAWAIPGPGRPLFEDATAPFVRDSPAAVDTHNAVRGPLLLISGTEDHTVPLKVTEAVVKLYADNPSRTDFIKVEGRGHSLTMDAGWTEVAHLVREWITEREPALA